MGRSGRTLLDERRLEDSLSADLWGDPTDCSEFEEIVELSKFLDSNKVADNEYGATALVTIARRYCSWRDPGLGWHVFCTLLEGSEDQVYELEEELSGAEYDEALQNMSDATAQELLSTSILTPELIASALLFTKYVESVRNEEKLEILLDEWLIYVNTEELSTIEDST